MKQTLTYQEAKSLPIGTLIKEDSPLQSPMIVTENGIHYFDYQYYQKKPAIDPTQWAIGVPIIPYDYVNFLVLDLPKVNLEYKTSQ